MIFHPKTKTAPPCLEKEKRKASGSYNCPGVLELLKRDFKNKCYICEDKAPHAINTEHFIPHKGNIDLKFDWNNLFYCCAHCNNTKLAKPQFDAILNCTVESDEADRKIKYLIKVIPKEKVKITALVDEPKVHNTVSLLLEIYNGTTPLKKIESGNLRDKLLKEIRHFQDLLFRFYDDSNTAEEQLDFKNKIIRELRASSGFTAFKRWILRDSDMAEDFSDYL